MDVIYSYSRAQAIEDGVLVDLSEKFGDLVREHYKVPVAVTASVWEIITKAVNNPRWMNDFDGVIHDILWMSRVYFRPLSESGRIFRVKIRGAGRKSLFDFKLVVGPGDEGEPVATISLPNED